MRQPSRAALFGLRLCDNSAFVNRIPVRPHFAVHSLDGLLSGWDTATERFLEGACSALERSHCIVEMTGSIDICRCIRWRRLCCIEHAFE